MVGLVLLFAAIWLARCCAKTFHKSCRTKCAFLSEILWCRKILGRNTSRRSFFRYIFVSFHDNVNTFMFSYTFDKSNFWDDTCSFFDSFDFKRNTMATDTQKTMEYHPKCVYRWTFLVIYFIFHLSFCVFALVLLRRLWFDRNLSHNKGCQHSSQLILIKHCFRFFNCHETTSTFSKSYKAFPCFPVFSSFFHILLFKVNLFSIITSSSLSSWRCSTFSEYYSLAIHT